MTEIVGPDGTRYKIIRNPLPDPQDYGWLEPVTDRDAAFTTYRHPDQGVPP